MSYFFLYFYPQCNVTFNSTSVVLHKSSKDFILSQNCQISLVAAFPSMNNLLAPLVLDDYKLNVFWFQIVDCLDLKSLTPMWRPFWDNWYFLSSTLSTSHSLPPPPFFFFLFMDLRLYSEFILCIWSANSSERLYSFQLNALHEAQCGGWISNCMRSSGTPDSLLMGH